MFVYFRQRLRFPLRERLSFIHQKRYTSFTTNLKQNRYIGHHSHIFIGAPSNINGCPHYSIYRDGRFQLTTPKKHPFATKLCSSALLEDQSTTLYYYLFMIANSEPRSSSVSARVYFLYLYMAGWTVWGIHWIAWTKNLRQAVQPPVHKTVKLNMWRS